jgi:hypothetical protein
VSKIRRSSFLILLTGFLLTLLIGQMAYAYDNIEYGFSITPPNSWSLIEDTGNADGFVGFVKAGSSATISVFVIEPTPFTLSEVVEEMKGEIPGFLVGNFSLVYEKKRSIGGLDCYEIEYILFPDPQFGMTMKARQVFFVENGKAFLVTYLASEWEYSDFLSDAENCIESFSVFSDSPGDSLDSTVLFVGIIASVVILFIVLGIFFLKKRQKQQLKLIAQV